MLITAETYAFRADKGDGVAGPSRKLWAALRPESTASPRYTEPTGPRPERPYATMDSRAQADLDGLPGGAFPAVRRKLTAAVRQRSTCRREHVGSPYEEQTK